MDRLFQQDGAPATWFYNFITDIYHPERWPTSSLDLIYPSRFFFEDEVLKRRYASLDDFQ